MQACYISGCPIDSLCIYYLAEQLGGDGRTPGFKAVRSNGDYATYKSYSGAYKFGMRYFGGK